MEEGRDTIDNPPPDPPKSAASSTPSTSEPGTSAPPATMSQTTTTTAAGFGPQHMHSISSEGNRVRHSSNNQGTTFTSKLEKFNKLKNGNNMKTTNLAKLWASSLRIFSNKRTVDKSLNSRSSHRRSAKLSCPGRSKKCQSNARGRCHRFRPGKNPKCCNFWKS